MVGLQNKIIIFSAIFLPANEWIYIACIICYYFTEYALADKEIMWQNNQTLAFY